MEKQIRQVRLSYDLLSSMLRQGTRVQFVVAKGFPGDVEILHIEPDFSSPSHPALKMTVRGFFEGEEGIEANIELQNIPDEKVASNTNL
jgi:hypothetical protein